MCWRYGTDREERKKMKNEIEVATKVFAEEKTYLQLKKEANELILSGKDLQKMSFIYLRTIPKSFNRNGDKGFYQQKNRKCWSYIMRFGRIYTPLLCLNIIAH